MVQKRMDAEEHDDVKDVCLQSPYLAWCEICAEGQEIRRNSLACNAAHNLMLLYTATGSMDLAEAKSRWLAV
jgi:hypothetical protein